MTANHYGPFLMTVLLMDLLKQSAPSRIVNVGSKAHVLSFLDPEDPFSMNPVMHWWPLSNYANSKMATLLTSVEMSRRLHGTGVTINTLHPGSVDSEIFRNWPSLVTRLMRMFLKTLDEGIQTTLFVALSTSLKNVSGEYFRNCKLGKPHKSAQKMDWQKMMFEESVKIVGLTEKDPFV
jgi:NAD(P)-dependent dehydrogenase (short-subunit alcohol dehydrogenase family)